MSARKSSDAVRPTWTLLGILASSATFAIGCNAILGIDEGHLVSGSGGAGGSTFEDSGAGGSLVDASGTGGAADGGEGGQGTGGQGTGGSSGAGAGGKGTGGAGGKGTGGASTGGAGASGAAGTGGAGGSGGATKPDGVPGEVHCGTSSCKLPGQVCCVDTTSGDAHCATSCDSTSQLPVSCDGAEDCSAGKPKCCYPTGGTAAACMASCPGRTFCGQDRDCVPGQRCAAGVGPLANVFICTAVPTAKRVWCAGSVCNVALGELCCYDKTAKTEQCSAACAAGDVRFACDTADDCASGASCCETRTGVGLFTGTQCVAGGCAAAPAELTCGGTNACTAAGEQCCLHGGGSGCGATCAAEVVCGTDADCTAAQSCTVITEGGVGTATGRTVCSATP
jgi:hypothetical protein